METARQKWVCSILLFLTFFRPEIPDSLLTWGVSHAAARGELRHRAAGGKGLRRHLLPLPPIPASFGRILSSSDLRFNTVLGDVGHVVGNLEANGRGYRGEKGVKCPVNFPAPFRTGTPSYRPARRSYVLCVLVLLPPKKKYSKLNKPVKEFVTRLNSLMNLLLIASLALFLAPPANRDSPLKLATMAQDDCKQVLKTIDELKSSPSLDPKIRPVLDELAAAASRIKVAEAGEITFGMIRETRNALDALSPYMGSYWKNDKYRDIGLAQDNLALRVHGLYGSFVDAKLVASTDVVLNVDHALQHTVGIPTIGVSVNYELASFLFGLAVITAWLYATSVLVTVRRIMLQGSILADDSLILRSWIGFQHWPLGPLVTLAWLVVLPFTSLTIFISANLESEDLIGWTVTFLLFAALLLVALFRARKAFFANLETHHSSSDTVVTSKTRTVTPP